MRASEACIANQLGGNVQDLCGAERTARPLIVPENKEFVLDNGTSKRTAKQIDPKRGNCCQGRILQIGVARFSPVRSPEVQQTAVPNIATRPGLSGDDARKRLSRFSVIALGGNLDFRQATLSRG